jgi:hypothetical protein
MLLLQPVAESVVGTIALTIAQFMLFPVRYNKSYSSVGVFLSRSSLFVLATAASTALANGIE